MMNFRGSLCGIILTGALLAFLASGALAQPALRVSGSTTVNPVVSEAAEVLRNENELGITIDTAGGSTGGINALGIKEEDGRVIEATGSNIASGAYPMSRPLFVITNGEPTAAAKVLIEYLLSTPGQELVAKHGYLRLADLK